MNQAIDKGTSGTVWSTKALLAACLMVVVTLLAACLMVVVTLLAACLMAAQPAHASTTFTVNDTRDSPDASSTAGGTCDIDVFIDGNQCTLRAAIQQANATLGADTIKFAIPFTGVQTIHVNSGGFGALPAITEQVTIDGYTQPGASPNTLAAGDNAALKIELDGTNVPSGNPGLEILTADSSVIKGLVINRFNEGIEITGDSVANRIEGNFIGTDPTGSLARGNNLHGIVIDTGTSAIVVGGSTPAARNLISGNGDKGVLVQNSNGNRIQGNYIGTDKSGTKDLGNVSGGVTILSGFDNLVGGTTAASRNVISGNGGAGYSLRVGSNNKVLGNRIGTTVSGTVALGNDAEGVFIADGSNNSVGDGTSGGSNTIAFNGGDGIAIFRSTSTGNAISRNSVFSNAGLGIDLIGGFEDAKGNTANDPGDIDGGPNGLQNKPSVGSAKTVSGTTTIKGTLSSEAGTSYKVEFYSNPSGDEGKKFVGTKSVTTGADGKAAFTFAPAKAVSVGQAITATATNATTGSPHDTSEFSAPRTVATA